jgi:hypothetical protein
MRDERATEEQVLKFVHIQLKMGPPVQTPRNLWSCAMYIFPAYTVTMDRDLHSVVPLLSPLPTLRSLLGTPDSYSCLIFQRGTFYQIYILGHISIFLLV